MISDEMRELLSAYVDGELRDTDAARVEDMSKRDAELRREIEAFRKLRRKLRAWDEAEHGGAPSPRLAERALARAHAFFEERKRLRRGRVFGGLFARPAALAAGLLLAAGAGVLFAQLGADDAPAAAEAPTIRALASYPDLSAPVPEIDAYDPAPVPPLSHQPVFTEVLKRHAKGYAVINEKISEKTLVFLREQEAIERRCEARKLARANESRTGTPTNLMAMALTDPYEAVEAPVAGMVLLRHQEMYEGLPYLRGLSTDAGIRVDEPVARHAERILVKTFRLHNNYNHVLLLGEVLASEPGASERARLVSSSAWIASRSNDFARIAWADDVKSREAPLHVQGFVVGPRTRQRLLQARGLDRDFLGWLAGTYRGGLLPAVRGAQQRYARDVEKLMTILRDRPEASGFAVVAGGKVQGVEMFATHELMLDLAPRLLVGYMLEAGPKGIEVRTARENQPLLDRAKEILEKLPERTTHLGELKKWDGDIRAVNLTDGTQRVIAHGLVRGNRPLHLTLFGE